MIAYETQLDQDVGWALREGSKHFDGTNAVHDTLRRLCRRLDELGIAYALVGGMAMFLHGYRRFTEDVHLLVTDADLRRIHAELEGLGYFPPFAGSKNLRDAETGVRIEFLVTGQYPGDGKPQPVALPDPASVSVEIGGMNCVNVPTLVQLKLASGASPGRMKDLADVQELIRALSLPLELRDALDPTLREKYRELWSALQ